MAQRAGHLSLRRGSVPIDPQDPECVSASVPSRVLEHRTRDPEFHEKLQFLTIKRSCRMFKNRKEMIFMITDSGNDETYDD